MVEDAFLNSNNTISSTIGATISTDKKIRVEKKRLREHYKAIRLSLSAQQRMQAAESVANQLLGLPTWPSAQYVAGYWATQGELPLHIVQMHMQAPQIWCLPMVQSDNTLKFAPWRAGDALVSNQYGIPEPDLALTSTLSTADLSIILLPLLAYTRTGQRLGMGGGYYDRSLTFRQNQASAPLIIGVAYSSQEADSLPSEAWDVKLDMLINEREVLRF